MESMKAEIQKVFKERFGEAGALYASAGRINLIGEHTDYNGGFVFPGAIDKVIMAEIKPNGSQTELGTLYIRYLPRNSEAWRRGEGI